MMMHPLPPPDTDRRKSCGITEPLDSLFAMHEPETSKQLFERVIDLLLGGGGVRR